MTRPNCLLATGYSYHSRSLPHTLTLSTMVSLMQALRLLALAAAVTATAATAATTPPATVLTWWGHVW